MVLKSLVSKAYALLERDLCDRNIAWIERYIQWAKAKEGKKSGIKASRMTKDAVAIVNKMEDAMAMTLDEVNQKLESLKTEFDAKRGDDTIPRSELQEKLDEITLLERFGALKAKSGHFGYVLLNTQLIA